MTIDYKIRSMLLRYYTLNKQNPHIVRNIVEFSGISKSTIYSWINDYKIGKININNTYKIRITRTNNYKFTSIVRQYIVDYFTSGKYANIKNLCRSIRRNFNVVISKASVYRILKSEKITRKIINYDNSPYTQKTQKKQIDTLVKDLNIIDNKYDHNNVISVDEFHIKIDSINKKYGWGKRGKRAVKRGQHINIKSKPDKNGKHRSENVKKSISIISAIDNEKTVSVKSVHGPVNGVIFNVLFY